MGASAQCRDGGVTAGSIELAAQGRFVAAMLARMLLRERVSFKTAKALGVAEGLRATEHIGSMTEGCNVMTKLIQ